MTGFQLVKFDICSGFMGEWGGRGRGGIHVLFVINFYYLTKADVNSAFNDHQLLNIFT